MQCFCRALGQFDLGQFLPSLICTCICNSMKSFTRTHEFHTHTHRGRGREGRWEKEREYSFDNRIMKKTSLKMNILYIQEVKAIYLYNMSISDIIPKHAAAKCFTYLLHIPSWISGPVSVVSQCPSPCDASLSPPVCAATCGP